MVLFLGHDQAPGAGKAPMNRVDVHRPEPLQIHHLDVESLGGERLCGIE